MTGKFLRRSAGFLISCASIVTATVLACAGGDWDGQEGSMFTPQIINQPQYAPFFRTTAYPFYDGYDDRGIDHFKQENSKEWLTYLGSGTSREAVNYWMYEAGINQVDSMIFDLKKKPANLTENSKLYSLKNVAPEKANSFLYYLGYAKRNETFAAVEMSSWGERQVPATVAPMDKQITGGVSFLSKAKDPFMKQRHAFQLLRTYFFAEDYEKVIAIYDANETYFAASGNNLKWRALSYKAGAYYRQKDFAKANYLFSKVFDGCDALKRSAYLCFRPQEEKDWQQSLALAKTAREKQVLWQLLGLHHDPVRAMKEILALDAKSELANILLVRAVNIEEEKYEGNLRMDHLDSPSKIPGAVSKELRIFLDEMSEKYAGNNPDLWHMAAAYINYIQLNYTIGDKQLKRVNASSLGPLQDMQYHMVSLVGKMGRLKVLDAKTEKELLPDLKVIIDVRNTQNDMRVYSARDWVRQMLAAYAEQAGQKEKAELISPSTASLALNTTEQIDKVLAYFDKPNPSEFEFLFFQNNLLSKMDYQELKAIRYAQQDKLEDALRTFKSISGHNKGLAANPFTIHLRDCHECDFVAQQKVKYNSISFIEKMIEMKNIAKANPKEAAQNYFLVANGFYNMTHFGNARLFYAMNRVDDSFYYYDITSLAGNKGDMALNYYLLALKNSSDKEFRAKCTFMAAKCELNSYYYSRPENAPENFKAGIYFASLQKEFSDTKYYKEVIKECGYFRTYLAQR